MKFFLDFPEKGGGSPEKNKIDFTFYFLFFFCGRKVFLRLKMKFLQISQKGG